MTSWDKVCRICSSPAHYSIFDKIPAYVHEASEVATDWPRLICDMLRDTTGLTVTPNDGLPGCICALCISYMKHAVVFHDRAINNTRSLRAILLLAGTTTVKRDNNDNAKKKQSEIKGNYEETLSTIASHYKLLNFNRENGTCKVNKELFTKYWYAEITHPPKEEDMTFNLREMALLFYERREDKRIAAYKRKFESKQPIVDWDNDDDDDGKDIVSATANECLFSYREKHFQEDDVLEQEDLLKYVSVMEPENCYERKCRACHYRSLLEHTFNKHLDSCVEYKFLLLVEELNLLLNIRQRKAISPHEYVRRFIFCLRKTCEWLCENCDEMMRMPAGRTSNGDHVDGGIIIDTSKKTTDTLNNRTHDKVEEPKEDENETVVALQQGVHKRTRRGGKRHSHSRHKTQDALSNEDEVNLAVDETTPTNGMQDNDDDSDNHAFKMLEMQKQIREMLCLSEKSEAMTNKTLDDDDNNIWQNALETLPMDDSEIRPIQSPPPQNNDQRFLVRPKARYSIKSPPASSLPVPLMAVARTEPQEPSASIMNGHAAHCASCNMFFDTLRHFEIHIAVSHNKTNTNL